MEELYAVLETNLANAVITQIDNGVLQITLENGKELELFLEDDQVEELVDQIQEDNLELE
jgi:hypothetical protein